MAYLKTSSTNPFAFLRAENSALGKELNAEYLAASPFPHIQIDDFLDDELLEYCLQNFPIKLADGSQSFDREQERQKFSFNPDLMEPGVRSLFYSFNSLPFIQFLENLTGISGLIPDPYFSGAGFHELTQGGYLSVHADFNYHEQLKLERRINVLIYLNKGWKREYGGQLELWNEQMEECVRSIEPEFNRAVVFNTTADSFHGNPNPVNHEEGVSRRSIALYYYTATWSETKRERTTNFKRRPDSKDKRDWYIVREEFLREYLPPFISRRMINLLNRFLKPR